MFFHVYDIIMYVCTPIFPHCIYITIFSFAKKNYINVVVCGGGLSPLICEYSKAAKQLCLENLTLRIFSTFFLFFYFFIFSKMFSILFSAINQYHIEKFAMFSLSNEMLLTLKAHVSLNCL